MRFSFGLLLTASACAGYQPGTFARHGEPFPGERATLGCLDVAIAANQDSEAPGTIARITVANRCDRAVALDFTQLRATRRSPNGDLAVSPSDPRGELRPALLDARSIAIEYLEYPAEPGALCFDLRGLARNTAHELAPLCIGVRLAEVPQ